ncbi:enolase 4 [Periophthalmus magnuspinnatus]|uniref:enolase 4 n=1 Tax=Periophthalmus magnuspinnatus TaxID=409849 RepID=UPI0024367D46|nr:enolase 4 [Periophthalmus magnuspinnatus]
MSLFYAQSSVCKDAEELTELRQSAADFYRLNHVPEHLERALNELFTRRPSDLHGYLAEFFSALSSPPRISRVEGLEVLDSRGQPSILAQVYCIIRNHEKLVSSASVASYFGPKDSNSKDRAEQVSNALQWIQDLNQQLQDLSPEDQSQVDHILSGLYLSRLEELSESQPKPDDSTSTSLSNMADTPAPSNKKGKKGSAVKPPPPPEPPELLLSGGLSVGALSLSVARGGAQSRGVALYQHIAMLKSTQPPPQMHIPSLLISVLSCGKASPGKLNLFEEVLLIPKPGLRARQVMQTAQEVQREMQRIVGSGSKAGVSVTFGALLSDCGAPCLSAEKVEQPLDLLSEACSNLELNLGAELFVGLSCATPNLYDHSKGKYEVSSGLLKTPDEVVDLLQALLLKYPSVVTVIDPLRREDVEQWKRLAASVSESCSLLSDITFRVQAPPPPGVKGHVLKHVNHVTISDLIRVSTEQEGSVVLGPAYSEPSSDPALPDLAVGLGLDFLKLGGLSGAERTTRFNRLLAIEDELQREGCLVLKDKLLPPIFPQRPEQNPDPDQDTDQGPEQDLDQDQTPPSEFS